MEIVLNVAFVLAAVAFFKERLGLQRWGAIGAAFAVAAVIVFLPDVYAAFPAAAPFLQKIVALIGLFLAAPGAFDLAVDLKSR